MHCDEDLFVDEDDAEASRKEIVCGRAHRVIHSVA